MRALAASLFVVASVMATAAAVTTITGGCTFLVGFDEANGAEAGLSGDDADQGDDTAIGDDGSDIGSPTTDEDAADPDVTEIFDASDDYDAADGNPCANKPNGYPWKSTNALARCCGQIPVIVDGNGNCGSCGITCPSGQTCGMARTGHPGCHCVTDVSCQQNGYGGGATCYLGYCNCQCPTGAVTCTGQCRGGSICHDVSGVNYCAY